MHFAKYILFFNILEKVRADTRHGLLDAIPIYRGMSWVGAASEERAGALRSSLRTQRVLKASPEGAQGAQRVPLDPKDPHHASRLYGSNGKGN